MIRMPGRSHRGPLPPLEPQDQAVRDRLRAHVEHLAGRIGERNVWAPRELEAAAVYVEEQLGAAGDPVERHEFSAEGARVRNVVAERRGSDPAAIVVVGAHYDSVLGSPGANDNASGVAALLEIARLLRGRPLRSTVHFAGFVNEEPPFFLSDEMGSLQYARRCRSRGETVAAMLSLETIGRYFEAEGSQRYPFPLSALYPSTADFIAFVGDLRSRPLLRRVIGRFRAAARFPSEGAALPEAVPGVGWSDHWSFWQNGYPAVLVTDTAPYRDPAYHTADDRPANVDYDRLARVTRGLAEVVADLAGQPPLSGRGP
ncbi:MAG TPA: M28 family peptidase, partial [Vicinamibacteria bacterium]|nr:M28 family peptidase [Vicinamibacteria bacterium]